LSLWRTFDRGPKAAGHSQARGQERKDSQYRGNDGHGGGNQGCACTLTQLEFLGQALGAHVPGETTLQLLTTITFVLAGVLVVLEAKLPAAAVAGFAVAAGLIHGHVNGATLSPTGASLLELTGAVSAVFCLLAILSAQVTTVRAGWTHIAVRVAGSWIAAAGILVLGWLARPVVGA
jgi:hydrogenase/urease accessory protein HupE